jgi:serine/threonine protein phosphatase PrpC
MRIEELGGTVASPVFGERPRVAGLLEVTRAITDGHIKGITATPFIRSMTVSAEYELLLVCSDGIWDWITPSEAVCQPLAVLWQLFSLLLV